jgi:hypothetical protein
MCGMPWNLPPDQHAYDRERADELAWLRARLPAPSRRQLLRVLTRGAAAAAAARLAPLDREQLAQAADDHGNAQPDRVPFNDQGYAHCAVVTHVVTVG